MRPSATIVIHVRDIGWVESVRNSACIERRPMRPSVIIVIHLRDISWVQSVCNSVCRDYDDTL